MCKFIVLPLLVLLAACTDDGAIMPVGPDGPQFAKKCSSPPCDKGGDGGGGGEALPTDVAAIVFVKRGNLVVINADGSNQTVLYDAAYVSTPSWSGDGSSIVFHTYHDGEDSIRTIGIKVIGGVIQPGAVSASLLPCTPYSGSAIGSCQPAWSPIDDWIAVADGNTRDISRIRLVRANGFDSVVVYEAPGAFDDELRRWVYSFVQSPTWSRDGQRIAFEQASYGDPSCVDWFPCIKIIDVPVNFPANADGTWLVTASIPLNATDVGTFQAIGGLEWARTTDRLLFRGQTTSPTGGGIYTLDLANLGAGPSITPIITDGRAPVWSPEDEWIAWVLGRNDQLMLYSNSTKNSYKVASGVRDPDWLRNQRAN